MIELAKRGQCAFDDAALIHGLAAPPVDEGTWCEIAPDLFEQYNEFYSLGFEYAGATRSYGVVAVGKERIFAQTFRPAGNKPVAWALVWSKYGRCVDHGVLAAAAIHGTESTYGGDGAARTIGETLCLDRYALAI